MNMGFLVGFLYNLVLISMVKKTYHCCENNPQDGCTVYQK